MQLHLGVGVHCRHVAWTVGEFASTSGANRFSTCDRSNASERYSWVHPYQKRVDGLSSSKRPCCRRSSPPLRVNLYAGINSAHLSSISESHDASSAVVAHELPIRSFRTIPVVKGRVVAVRLHRLPRQDMSSAIEGFVIPGNLHSPNYSAVFHVKHTFTNVQRFQRRWRTCGTCDSYYCRF